MLLFIILVKLYTGKDFHARYLNGNDYHSELLTGKPHNIIYHRHYHIHSAQKQPHKF